MVSSRPTTEVEQCDRRAAVGHLRARARTARSSYRFFDYRRSAVETEQDGFFLRITGPGDWRYEGADLGILITRGRLMDDDGELNERAQQWLSGLRARYVAPAYGVVPAIGRGTDGA